MNAEVAARLKELMERHGAGFANEPELVRQGLADLGEIHHAEVAVIVAVAEEGLASTTLGASDAAMEGLVDELHEGRAIEPAAARWALEAWAAALEHAPPSDVAIPVVPAVDSATDVPSTPAVRPVAAAPTSRRGLFIGLGVAAAVIVAGIVTILAISGGDEPDVTTTTLAASTSVADTTSTAAGTPAFSPVVGACVRGETEVDCLVDRWDYKVLRVLDAGNPATQPYPGEAALASLARDQCPNAVSHVVIPPTEESWANAGSDEVICGQMSVFGATPEMLEEFGALCVFVDRDNHFLLTDCSERHDWVIQSVLEIGTTGAFPGDAGIADQAAACGEVDLFFGPTEITWSQDYGYIVCANVDNLPFADIVDLAIAELNNYWSQTFGAISGGLAYDPIPVERVIPYTTTANAPLCGDSPVELENAFYCGLGDFIAYDENFILDDFYYPSGDAAVAAILAHEWGHAITARLGIADSFYTDLEARYNIGQLDDAGIGGLAAEFSSRQEFQADCFAGAWAGWVDEGNGEFLVLTPGDRNKIVDALVAVRDEAYIPIELRIGSAIEVHGDSQTRVTNFNTGFEQGPSRCLGFFDGLVAPGGGADIDDGVVTSGVSDVAGLEALIPAIDADSCRIAEPGEGPGGTLAGVLCEFPGVIAEFWAAPPQVNDSNYESIRANIAATIPVDDVSIDDVWHRGDPDRPLGKFLGFIDSDASATLFWTYDAEGVLAVAWRPDGDLDAMFAWWQDPANV